MRKMNKLILLILLFKHVISDEEENNEKYIDLLPEEEKQEFLNRIARRILEGIKSGETPNESHADITDDQLDAQNTYVQEILQDESKNFKNKQIPQSSENKDRFEGQDELDSNNGNKDDEHIDLTLREGGRQKRKNNDDDIETERTTELNYDVIPVHTVYEQFEKYDDTKNGTENVIETTKIDTDLLKEYKENISAEIKETSTDVLEKISFKSTELLQNQDLDRTEITKTLRKSYDKFKLGTTLITDFEPNSNENLQTIEDNINHENVTSTPTPFSKENYRNTTTDEDVWRLTQKIYAEDIGEESENSNVDKTTEVNQNSTYNEILQTDLVNTTTSSIIIESNILDSTTVKISNSVSPQNVNYKIIDNILRSKTNTRGNTLQVIQSKKTENENADSSDTISTIKINVPASSKVAMSANNGDLMQKKILDTSDNSMKSVNILNLKPPKGINDGIPIKSPIIQTNLVDKKTILRAGLDNTDMSQINDMLSSISDTISLENIDRNSKKVKVYEVYEVDPNKSHFSTSGKVKVKEHPYYVPVYNYASDNAYFKPYNKFGPNIEDVQNNSPESGILIENSNNKLRFDLPNIRNRFSAYNHKEKGNQNVRNIKKLNKKQVPNRFGFAKPVKHNIINQNVYYDPEDYSDMEYYYGRMLRTGKSDYVDDNNDKHFPNSNEPDHPVSSIHKSNTVKGHLRAIRKLLYLQKIFGYVPDDTEMIVRKANQYLKSDMLSKKPKKDITMDYYYNRDESKEQDANSRVFRVNKSIIKQTNPHIVPLTPKPHEFIPISESKQTQTESKQHIRNDKSQNLQLGEVPFSEMFQSMLIVLEDAIKLNNEDLIKYDWLKTTVNIQAAIRKLIYLIEKLQYGEYVHPKDVELIKYTLYLFKSSKEYLKKLLIKQTSDGIIDEEAYRAKKDKIKKVTLPTTKRKIKKPLKLWKDVAAYLLRNDKVGIKQQKLKLLFDFEDLLQSLLFYLNDFHDAVKHIATITEYKNQTWFQDLKDIYLKGADKKYLGSVILHLSLSRLLDLVEESSVNGIEDSFRIFVMNNEEVVKRSREESIFILNILEELRRMNSSISSDKNN